MTVRRIGLALVLAVAAVAAFPQQSDLDEITANDEFRWGVTSMHAGRINEAIASFARSLSFAPDRALTRYWLGRAYYFAGFERPALDEWRWIVERNGETAVLNKWIERVELSQGLTTERLGLEVAPGRYVPMVDLLGVQNEIELFRRPTMVRPRADGYFYVVSFGTHTIALLDPNGVREDVIDGGLEGLDRPFDVLPLSDGSLLVSEFGADRIARISPAGNKIGTFGTTGVGDGELLGPQFLAGDDQGHVYAADYGNQRVAKFTTDGEFLFSFGEPTRSFDGLESPAGIAVVDDRLYVADTTASRLVVFDSNGNHLGEITTPVMQAPEGLSVFDERRLLVGDGNRLYLVDVTTEVFTVLSELADGRRLLGASIDANRNLLAADFSSNSLLVLAASEELYTGLNVEVDYVNSSDHPTVYAAVSVTDRNGEPLLGLDESNFRITEDRFPTGLPVLSYAGYQDSAAAVALLVDGSLAGEQTAIQTAALEVYDALSPTDRIWVISAGELPVVEATPPVARLESADAATRASTAVTGVPGRIDLGIRLAVSQLLPELGQRSIVLVSNGEVRASSFATYSLTETAEHLENNNVRLSVIYTGDERSDELEYLVDVSGGSEVFVYEPRGARVVIEELRTAASGTYLLQYQSVHDSDFGRRYIPLEVEAYLLERSGRDEVGYYGPLEF